MNWLPVDSMRYSLVIMETEHIPVYGELLFREATWHETLLRPFFYVIDSKRALSFGEAQLYFCSPPRLASVPRK